MLVTAEIITDRDLTSRDIQQLVNADAMVAFFATLGYDTSARLPQTPAAMGITAQELQRKIRRIERIAYQEFGALQVYVIELDSVTVAATLGLARALRDRAGDYLLVITDDYQQIDFVLLERNLVAPSAGGLATPRVSVRPRTLTVMRRDPGTVALRVLRRFTYTESDAEAQYDKLLSAYTVADWSEPYYNNRALFSDYFLNERLREMDPWVENPKPTYLRLRELYSRARDQFSGAVESVVHTQLIEPTLEALGFSCNRHTADAGNSDYLLATGGAANAKVACLAYAWDRNLDGKDDTRDTQRPNANPGALVVSILDSGVASWAIVTNGKVWRLYAAAAHSRATNYYEIDLEETLAMSDPNEAFRYFWLFFRAAAFQPREVTLEGERRDLSFVDQVVAESANYARRLGEQLKDRVFENVFPQLARGFIDYIRYTGGEPGDLSQERLDEVFRGTLTLLYRLLFLLYAEARDLLPVREVRGYWEKSLSRLKEEIAQAAGAIEDNVPARLSRAHLAAPNETGLYERLEQLVRIIDRGNPDMNTPVYNGGLFLSDVADDDTSSEAQAARFLLRYKVPDRFLALALDQLARDVDAKRGDLVPIDYKSLGVRQLGSIYEGLLEFRLRIASEKMAVVRGKKTEEIVPYREAIREKRVILTAGRGRDAAERTLPKGAVYLENDRQERKASGSYYTPDHIVEYIVAQAVGPVLHDHLERLRPRFREAQQAYRQAQQRQAAFEKQGMRGDDPEKVANSSRGVVDDLFTFRVLDPAMGSGHFLVEAVDFVTDRMLDFLNAFPWNPVQAELRQTREAILAEMERQGVAIDPAKLNDVNLLKRHVLKRCIYGVDLNAMAVELAKVSLWLDCFTLGAPLSFLDHHLKRGNSLIGTSVEEVKDAIEGTSAGHLQLSLFAQSQFTGIMLATDLMRRVGELSDVTAEQVRESRREYGKASDALAPFKRILNVYVSRWFGNEPTKGKGKNAPAVDKAMEFLRSPDAQAWLQDPQAVMGSTGDGSPIDVERRAVMRTALAAAKEKGIFHWELEFPEVFYGPCPGTSQVIERLDGAGFDAVIGNPPYDVLASEELGYDVGPDVRYFENQNVFTAAIRGKNNLYKLFVCRAFEETRRGGALGMIVPMPLLGDDQAREVRKRLLMDMQLLRIEAFPQKDDPKRRVFPEAKLSTTVFIAAKTAPLARFLVRTHPGRDIDENSPSLWTAPEQIANYDPGNLTICSCSQDDWELATRIIRSCGVVRLGLIVKSYQGEINETNERPKKTLRSSGPGPLILRGANISLYAVRDASQGEDLYLDVQRFLDGKGPESKAYDHKYRRIGFQRSAPQNNFRRIIAAPIDQGQFCFDTGDYSGR